MMSEQRKATIFDIARFYEDHNCSKPGMGAKCEKCEISSYNNNIGLYCTDFVNKHPDKANEIILKWCDEHPLPTRQSEFLKEHPDAPLSDDGVLLIVPCAFDKKYREMSNTYGCCADCNKCREAYWGEEV